MWEAMTPEQKASWKKAKAKEMSKVTLGRREGRRGEHGGKHRRIKMHGPRAEKAAKKSLRRQAERRAKLAKTSGKEMSPKAIKTTQKKLAKVASKTPEQRGTTKSAMLAKAAERTKKAARSSMLKKVGIGAGVGTALAAAGYGAYRLKKSQRKEEALAEGGTSREAMKRLQKRGLGLHGNIKKVKAAATGSQKGSTLKALMTKYPGFKKTESSIDENTILRTAKRAIKTAAFGSAQGEAPGFFGAVGHGAGATLGAAAAGAAAKKLKKMAKQRRKAKEREARAKAKGSAR